MKKLFIITGILSSLCMAQENFMLRTQTSNAWSSIQARLPLNMSLTLAGCSILTVYAGYKALMRYRTSVQKDAIVDEKLAELVKVAAPYLYVLKCKNYIAVDKILNIAARDSDVINLLPKESKNYPVVGLKGAYYSSLEEYLHQKIFTRNNVDAAKIPNTNDVRPKEQSNECNFIQDAPKKRDETNYNCVMTDDTIKKINPTIFFQSSQFLEHSSADGLLNIDFKSEAMRDHNGFAVRLSFIKNNGLVSYAAIYDYRESIYEDHKDK